MLATLEMSAVFEKPPATVLNAFCNCSGVKAFAEDHAGLRQIVDRIAPAIEKQRMAGGDGLASADRPAADDAIQHGVVGQEPPPFTKRQIISPVGIEDMTAVERRRPIVEPRIADGVPRYTRGLIGFVQHGRPAHGSRHSWRRADKPLLYCCFTSICSAL